jgi:transposase
MKVREVVLRAIARKLTWSQAADILGISYSSMERMRRLYERRGYDGFWVRANHRPHQKSVPLATVEHVLLLYQEKYSRLSLLSFCKKLRDEHGVSLSDEWVAQALNEAGLLKPSVTAVSAIGLTVSSEAQNRGD